MKTLTFIFGFLLFLSISASGQVAQQWVSRYNGTGNAEDAPIKVVVDNNGNSYVTGYSDRNGTGFNGSDYATIKYNSSGVLQWIATYNGPGNIGDYASGIAVDQNGNVYVTGTSWGNGTSADYATIKYDVNGVQQWVQRYNGTMNNDDYAYAITVDQNGNVYVTGYSSENVTGHDCTTIKYNTNGVQQWIQKYNGSGSATPEGGWAIEVDQIGNVYVGGYGYFNGHEDYLTIKYDANGNQQWVQTYNGPGNNSDVVKAIAVDQTGNVYVTGYSIEIAATGVFAYATIKYNSNGVQQWVQRYTGPGNNTSMAQSIAIDQSGNVYITGFSYNGTNSDYATIKYNTNGVQQWVQRYNGPGNAVSIAVDQNGNVYVTGGSVGNGTGNDYTTIKYDANGIQQWIQSYNGTGNGDDGAQSIAIDQYGNVYVTGGSTGNGTGHDYATIKYVQTPNTPVLASPLNNSINIPINQTFKWNKTSASTYRFQIATDVSFNNLVVNDSTITDTTKAVTGLNNNTTYYWRVNAKNIAGTSGYSSVWNFSTIPPVPSTPALVNPANNAVNQPLTLNLVWNKVQYASNYRVQLATDVGFSNIIVNDSTLTDSVKTISGLNNITDYWWRVQAKNISGTGSFSGAFKFTTIVPLPSAPSLLSPLNNSIGNQLSLNLVWSKPQYASGYRILVSTDNAFSNIIINDSTLTDSLKTLTGLNPLTYYWWKVQAKNAAGWGNYSSAYSFKTLGTPTTVNLLQPNNNAVNQPVSLSFMWSKAIDQTFSIKSSELRVLNERKENNKSVSGDSPNSVSKYWFELTTDTSSFANLLRDTTLSDTTMNVTALSNSTGYFWRVKAKNEIGWGSFTNWFKFTTIIAAPNVPILVSPLHLSFGNEITSLNLVWRKPASAVSYRLQLATDSMFTNLVFNDSTLTDTVKNFTNLLPLTYYYWRVNSKNIGGTSGYSYPWMFKTKGSPNNVTLINPPNNAVNQPISIAFKWNLPTEQTFARGIIKGGRKVFGDNPNSIQKYWFELTTDTITLANMQRDSLLTDTTKTISGLTNLTSYWWRVKAKNEAGWGMFGGWFKLTTITANPTVPLLYSPQNNALNISLSTSLVWYKLQNATSYNLLLAKDSLFTNIILNDSTLTDSIKAITNLDTSTVYYWKVRAKNIGGYGAFGSVWKFKTVPPPPNAPNLISPLNGSTNQPQSALFDWDSLTTAVNYRLRVATDSLFTNTILDTSTVNSSFRAYTNLLNLNVKYYWKVNASNPGGTGQYSSTWSFTTTAVGIMNISQSVPKEYKLYNNYPNPFNPTTRIMFDVPKSANVKLVVYDITGKEIARLVNGQLQPGTYEYEWNAATFASGVYFCRLESNEYTKIMRVVLIK